MHLFVCCLLDILHSLFLKYNLRFIKLLQRGAQTPPLKSSDYISTALFSHRQMLQLTRLWLQQNFVTTQGTRHLLKRP